MTIKVVVSGTGKMGRQIMAAVSAEPGLEPVGVLARHAAEEYLSLPDGSGLIPFGADAAALFTRTRPDVVVDFTDADHTPYVAKEALEAGARLVIGTSGLSDAFLRELEGECARLKLGAVVASNFALGAVLAVHLSKIAAGFFDNVEIIEMHNEGKPDAPSGTSIATARRMAEGRERPFERSAAKKETVENARGAAVEGVTIHSVRLPGMVAHQQVIFGGPGETLTIRHDSTSRESFMPGVVLAIRHVVEREDAVLGLEALLGIG